MIIKNNEKQRARFYKNRNAMRTILSLVELSLAGALFTVSLLGVVTHATGTEISLATNILFALIGAAGTFTILSRRAHIF